ncbi:MAG: hypothetical protein ACRDLL_02920 [Solirubrobacterales bacterium]
MSATAERHLETPIAVCPDTLGKLGLSAARAFREDFRGRMIGPIPPIISFADAIDCDPVFVELGLAEGLADEWRKRRRLAWACDISGPLTNQLDQALRGIGLQMIGASGELLGADRAVAESLASAKTRHGSFTTSEFARDLGLTRLAARNRLVSLARPGMVERVGTQSWRAH